MRHRYFLLIPTAPDKDSVSFLPAAGIATPFVINYAGLNVMASPCTLTCNLYNIEDNTEISAHFQGRVYVNLLLYVPWNMFQCVDKPTRCNTSYEWSLLSIIWLYMFRTITSPPSGDSSHKLYDALVCSCYQASLAVVRMYIHATARLA